MDEPPLRIECTDISHIQGTDVVASLVVFEDGLPRKSDYRRYRIREAAGDGHSDDVASIAEVVRRRFQRYQQDKTAVPAGDDAGDRLEGEVSAADPRAQEAGMAMLRQGGNATDAAIATMLLLVGALFSVAYIRALKPEVD